MRCTVAVLLVAFVIGCSSNTSQPAAAKLTKPTGPKAKYKGLTADELIVKFRDRDGNTHHEGYIGLVMLGDEYAVYNLAQEASGPMSGRAVEVLGEMGLKAKAALPELERLRDGKEKFNRGGLVVAIESIRGTFDAKRDVAESKDPEVRAAAIHALAGHGLRVESIPIIKLALKDPDPNVRKAAKDVLTHAAEHGEAGTAEAAKKALQ